MRLEVDDLLAGRRPVRGLRSAMNALKLYLGSHGADSVERLVADVEVQVDRLEERLASVYAERQQLVAYLCYQYPATLQRDPDKPDLSVVVIELPTGQVSWHLHPSDLTFFQHVPWGPSSWDGHSRQQKYLRIRRLGELLAAPPDWH